MEVERSNAGGLDSKCELLPERPVTQNVASIESKNDPSDCTSYDKLITEELDSIMDELDGRLKVSRMVSDSVIKGIVRALEEECAERISLNEERISNACSKLLNQVDISAGKYLVDQFLSTQRNGKVNDVSTGEILEIAHLKSQSSVRSHIEYVNRLKIKTDEWIHKLHEEDENAKRTDSSKEDALWIEVRQCRCSRTDAIHRFCILDINSLETLLTETSAYLSAVISSDSTLNFEQESEEDIQIDISNTLLDNLTSLRHQYEAKILDQKALMIDSTQSWQKKLNELATLRRDLDDINNSLVNWESGSIFPHINHESLEERNPLKKKDLVQRKPTGNNITAPEENSLLAIKKNEISKDPVNTDSSRLMCMSKEELICHFKNEMFKMNRQHDAVIQEMTENLFSLKRERLKEKGSSHLNFRKDKDVELVRKRISEIISKLDDILLVNENVSAIHDDETLCCLREKIDAIFLENQRLLSQLAVKRKETVPDCSNVLHTAKQSPKLLIDVDYADQIEKLQWDIEALKFEMSTNDAMYKSVLLDLFGELGNKVEGMYMETKIYHFTYFIVFGEVVRDAFSRINAIMLKCFEEKSYLSKNLSDKEKALFMEIEENKILKKKIESSSPLLKAKEILALNLEKALKNMREQFDSLCHECDVLRDLVIEQELVIVEGKVESDLISSLLKENLYQIHQSHSEIVKINQDFKFVSVALHDAEKEKLILQSKVLEIQTQLASEITNEKEQRKLVELVLSSMSELEYKVKYMIKHNESRLKVLICKCDELSEQAGVVNKKFLWYKELFERRCEDLQKAETEVDLLGDEVDNLLSLLGKIYLSLEHYSSVLQYYPGVMETLKLIRREVNAETSKSF